MDPDHGTARLSQIPPAGTAFFSVLILLSTTWFVLSVYRITFSVALPDFLEVTSITYIGISFLFGGLFVGYALSQFPAGTLADRTDPHTILLGSALAASISLASLSVAESYVHVFIAVFLVGTGIGSFRSVSQIVVSTHAPTEFEGRALGLLTAAEPFSYVVGPVAVALVLETYDVYTMPLVLALAPIPLAVLVYTNRPSGRPPNVPSANAPSFHRAVTTLRKHLLGMNTLLLLGLGTAFSATTNSLIAILPYYLVETTSLSLTLGGLYAGGIFGVGAIAALLGGAFRDRVGALPVLVVGFGTAAMALSSLGFVSSVSYVLVVLALFSLGLNSVLPARDRVINAHARACSETHTGAMIGGFRSLCYLGGGLGAVVAGLTFAVFGLAAGFGLLIAYLLLGGICSVALWRTEDRLY
ncbi:MFS transporter [Natrialbaceae archaeon A-gly3]